MCGLWQLHQQNVELKRHSQQLLQKMQLVDIDINDDVDGLMPDSSTGEDNTETLNRKINRK